MDPSTTVVVMTKQTVSFREWWDAVKGISVAVLAVAVGVVVAVTFVRIALYLIAQTLNWLIFS